MIFRFVLVKVGLFNGLTGSRDAVRKDWVGSSQFGPDHLHHPVLPNRGFPARVKMGRFCGDFAGIVPLFRSPVTLAVSPADFSLLSLHPKIPFPAVGLRRANTVGQRRKIEIIWGQPKRAFRTRSALIAGSIRGLRTAGSILPEHREVARCQYRAANDLRPLL